MKKIQIKIPSVLENIKVVESFIDNVKETYQINDDIYGNIMVAVTESVSNSIIHGNKLDKNKEVNLMLILKSSDIKIIIEDEGDGFDVEKIPDPTHPNNLQNPCGRGIFLIKHLCDNVSFNDNGKKIELSFKI